ncbi:hypothetical protein BGZ83_009538 [Gryganskiella cystojenkinii]|nr:hypothetical protein BGZ83_009538 [Gryganskiella cystojenkinii]
MNAPDDYTGESLWTRLSSGTICETQLGLEYWEQWHKAQVCDGIPTWETLALYMQTAVVSTELSMMKQFRENSSADPPSVIRIFLLPLLDLVLQSQDQGLQRQLYGSTSEKPSLPAYNPVPSSPSPSLSFSSPEDGEKPPAPSLSLSLPTLPQPSFPIQEGIARATPTTTSTGASDSVASLKANEFEVPKIIGNIQKMSTAKKDDSSPSSFSPSTAHPSTSSMIPSHYRLSVNVKTVTDILTEWRFGFRNGPAIQDLNRDYGERWRNSGDKEMYDIRSLITQEFVQMVLEQNVPEEDAIQVLTAMSLGCSSWMAFSMELYDLARARETRKQGRPTGEKISNINDPQSTAPIIPLTAAVSDHNSDDMDRPLGASSTMTQSSLSLGSVATLNAPLIGMIQQPSQQSLDFQEQRLKEQQYEQERADLENEILRWYISDGPATNDRPSFDHINRNCKSSNNNHQEDDQSSYFKVNDFLIIKPHHLDNHKRRLQRANSDRVVVLTEEDEEDGSSMINASVKTIQNVLQEWRFGFQGGPALQDMILERGGQAWLNRRDRIKVLRARWMVVLEFVHLVKKRGLSERQAVRALEQLQGKDHEPAWLYRLVDRLDKAHQLRGDGNQDDLSTFDADYHVDNTVVFARDDPNDEDYVDGSTRSHVRKAGRKRARVVGGGKKSRNILS